MKASYRLHLAISILLFLPSISLMAQDTGTGYEPQSRILFIFDASYSMAGKWDGESKINIARRILIEMVDSLETVENVEMALRIYGHQSPVPPQDCSDTKLEVPFAPNNASRIRQKLRFISPKGTTPIAHSLALSAGDFPPCLQCRDIIILITDGVEACDGDPCEVSEELQKQGIILKPFVIGIGNNPLFKETFGCLGHYYEAPNKQKFRQAMRIVITQALNATSSQINLLDIEGNPTETDVSVILYDQFSGKIRYNMIHTLNSKGNPDTIALDHLGMYRIVAQTIPPVSKDSATLFAGKHNHIGVDAPQGSLFIVTAGNGKAYAAEKILVKQAGVHKTINVQKMGGVEKYIVGKYDLEIPVYPLIYLEDVEVLQSYTTTVEIPEPGQVNFLSRSPGYGAIYQISDGNQNWVVNLRSGLTEQHFNLQPGSYRVIFRQGNLKSTTETQIWDFSVVSGKLQLINF